MQSIGNANCRICWIRNLESIFLCIFFCHSFIKEEKFTPPTVKIKRISPNENNMRQATTTYYASKIEFQHLTQLRSLKL